MNDIFFCVDKFIKRINNADFQDYESTENFLENCGFVHEIYEPDNKMYIHEKGLYIFVFENMSELLVDFDVLWTEHKEVANDQKVRVSPLNKGGSEKIMYIGKTTEQSLDKRINKHFLGLDKSKRTGSMKLSAQVIQDSRLKYKIHVFKAPENIYSNRSIQVTIDMLEKILHDKLSPRIGK